MSAPKPGALLVISAILVIGVCVVLVSYAVAAVNTGDMDLVVGGVCMFPLFLALGLVQYFAVFRSRPGAGLVAAVPLFLIGLLFLLMLVGAAGEILSGREELTTLLLVFLSLSAIGSLILFAGWLDLRWWWLNLRWSRRVRAAASSVEEPACRATRFPRYSLRELMAAVTVVAAICGLAVWFGLSMTPKYAENVGRGDVPLSLPPEATEISYCRIFDGDLAYEFTIDEDGFRRWVECGMGSREARAAKVPVEPVSAPVTILRYRCLSPELHGSEFATIAKGLYYCWSEPHYRRKAAFDSTTNRAYFHFRSFR